MYCTFFGHRDAPLNLFNEVKKKIIYLSENHRIKEYLVGNNGNFDYIVQAVLQALVEEGAKISYCIYLSRIDEKALNGHQENTVFSEELEGVPPRFRISKRNDLLIKKSDFVICYARHIASNTKKLIYKASKSGLTILSVDL